MITHRKLVRDKIPQIIENSRIPPDFTERVLRCDKQCDRCGYCADVCRAAMIQPEENIC